VDALAEQLRVNYWKLQCEAMTGLGSLDGQEVMLAKPQTFMNLSGRAVKGLVKSLKLDASADLLVIQDELDLEPGTVRYKMGGGHAGHNGIRNIIDGVGREFARVRVGIGHPQNGMPVDAYVLQKLRGAGLDELNEHCATAAALALDWLQGKL
jgi:PTH1 family peptidyl-tRNA hydrolase